MIIRLATDADRPFLEAFAKAATAERGFESLWSERPIDWARVTLTDRTIALVAVRDEPIGCYVAVIQQHPIGGRLYGEQMLWYVRPEYRGTLAGPALLDAYEDCCLTHGITQVMVKTPVARPRLRRWLETRRGYQAVEVACVRELRAPPPDERIHKRREC